MATQCCEGCERDTSAKNALCFRCRSHGKSPIDDNKGREAVSVQVLAGTAEVDAVDDVEFLSEQQYHGFDCDEV